MPAITGQRSACDPPSCCTLTSQYQRPEDLDTVASTPDAQPPAVPETVRLPCDRVVLAFAVAGSHVTPLAPQSAGQPSPDRRFPSSHTSPESRTPSPQDARLQLVRQASGL